MLDKYRPDLLAKVCAKEMSVNAAMVLAGFRHETVTISLGDPVDICTRLCSRLSIMEVEELIAALQESIENSKPRRKAKGGAK